MDGLPGSVETFHHCSKTFQGRKKCQIMRHSGTQRIFQVQYLHIYSITTPNLKQCAITQILIVASELTICENRTDYRLTKHRMHSGKQKNTFTCCFNPHNSDGNIPGLLYPIL